MRYIRDWNEPTGSESVSPNHVYILGILVAATLLYGASYVFSHFRWPGFVEISMLSAPMVSILLSKYYLEAFRKIQNYRIRVLLVSLSALVVLLIFISLFGLIGIHPFDPWSLLSKIWVLIVTISVLYYMVNKPESRTKGFMKNKILIVLTNLAYLALLFYFLIDGIAHDDISLIFNIVAVAISLTIMIPLLFGEKDTFKRPLYVMIVSTILIGVLNVFELLVW